MKRKNLLVGLLAASALLSLTSCGEKDNTTTPTTEQPDYQGMLDTALNGLSVSSTATSNFTLTTLGAGNVNIVWTSSNADVITISGANATVTRPTFGAEDAKVTLTATATLGDVSKTKTFDVTVTALEDQSKKISDIKELAKGHDQKSKVSVIAHGVVTGYLYKSGSSDPEYKTGFYLTDSTGTIYVYGAKTAQSVNVGEELYFDASTYEYSNIPQLADPTNVNVIKTNADVDWSCVEKGKTIDEVVALGDACIGNVYEMNVQVYKNSYSSYAIETPGWTSSNGKTMNEYFSGSTSDSLTGYASLLRGYENEIVKVYFYVAGKNSSGTTYRGNVLKVLPFSSDEEQNEYISYSLNKVIDLNTRYTETTEVTLPSSMARFDGWTLSYSLTEGSQGATIEGNKLTITPTNTLQKFSVVVTATKTVGDTTYTKSVTLDQVKVKTSFESIAFADYVQLAAKENVYLIGNFVHSSGNNYYFVDAQGKYYLVYTKTTYNFEVGKTYIIEGTKTYYNGLAEISPDDVSVADILTIEVTPTDVNSSVATYVSNQALDASLQNQYVTLTGLYNNGVLIVTLNGDNHSVTLGSTTGLLNGHTYKINGFVGYNNNNTTDNNTDDKTTIYVSSYEDVTSNEDRVTLAAAAIQAQFAKTFYSDQNVVLDTIFDNVTISVIINDAANTLLEYNADTKTMSVSTLGIKTTLTQSFNVVITCGEKEETITITVKTYATTDTIVSKTIESLKTELGWADSKAYTSFKLDSNITVTTNGKYYASGQQFRLYKSDNPTFKLESTYNIKSVKITYVSQEGGCLVDPNGNSISSGTVVTVNANSITFSISATDTSKKYQVRITAIEVVYGSATPEEVSTTITDDFVGTWTSEEITLAITKEEISDGTNTYTVVSCDGKILVISYNNVNLTLVLSDTKNILSLMGSDGAVAGYLYNSAKQGTINAKFVGNWFDPLTFIGFYINANSVTDYDENIYFVVSSTEKTLTLLMNDSIGTLTLSDNGYYISIMNVDEEVSTYYVYKALDESTVENLSNFLGTWLSENATTGLPYFTITNMEGCIAIYWSEDNQMSCYTIVDVVSATEIKVMLNGVVYTITYTAATESTSAYITFSGDSTSIKYYKSSSEGGDIDEGFGVL